MQPFIGQIQAFGFNFAPRGWAACNGQLLSIAQHSALFSLLGTQYGGDGRTTFGLPDLQGRSMVNRGQGAGLSSLVIGQRTGREYMTLTVAEMPSHNHQAHLNLADLDIGDTAKAKNKAIAQNCSANMFAKEPTYNEGNQLSDQSITVHNAGGGQSFSIRGPILAVNFCIALDGTFPSRS